MAYVSVHVDLDEFDEDEIVRELESRGYKCIKSSKTGAPLEGDDAEIMSDEDFERIEHLFICGQSSAAREEALRLVGRVIGRDITH